MRAASTTRVARFDDSRGAVRLITHARGDPADGGCRRRRLLGRGRTRATDRPHQRYEDTVSGIEAISSRILDIRSTIGALSGQHVATGTMGLAGTVAASGTSATFGAALAQAVGTTAPSSPAGATAAAARPQLNADGVPEDLAVYGNGTIPKEALTQIGGTGHRLWAPAAESFDGLLAAAKADGVTIGITDSYRTYESQVDLVARKGLYSEGGLAAKPGTSDHGWGLSVDLDLDPKALAWMRANGAEHGFREDVPREPWHWTFQG